MHKVTYLINKRISSGRIRKKHRPTRKWLEFKLLTLIDNDNLFVPVSFFKIQLIQVDFSYIFILNSKSVPCDPKSNMKHKLFNILSALEIYLKCPRPFMNTVSSMKHAQVTVFQTHVRQTVAPQAQEACWILLSIVQGMLHCV